MSPTSRAIHGTGGTEIVVTGMTCQGCVNAVTRAVSRVAGVTDVAVDLPSGRLLAAGTASAANLIAAIEQAGFGLRNAGGGTVEESSDGRGGQSGG